MSECTHAVQFHGSCALCGKDLEFEPTSEAVQIIHSSKELCVTKEEAQRLALESIANLLHQRKLSLVIDLDQTILHATVDSVIGEWSNDPSSPNYNLLMQLVKFRLPESPLTYFVKLRPGLQEFLSSLAEMYELHIYTMGSKSYANQVVRLIDPDGSLFSDRVLSRDDNEGLFKDLKRIFPCDDSMVAVIDDRLDVWKWSQNIVPVKPYYFFITGDPNSPERISASSATGGIESHACNVILKDDDNELLHIKRILTSLHQKYFKAYDKYSGPCLTVKGVKIVQNEIVNVKAILSEMKMKVLDSVHVAFSGIVPTNQSLQESGLWKMAASFGADCMVELDDKSTHLVATKPGTLKVQIALKNSKVKVVKVEWLLDSIYLWKKQPETGYLLEPIEEPGFSERFDFNEIEPEILEISDSGCSDSTESLELDPPRKKRFLDVEVESEESPSDVDNYLETWLEDSSSELNDCK